MLLLSDCLLSMISPELSMGLFELSALAAGSYLNILRSISPSCVNRTNSTFPLISEVRLPRQLLD